MASASTTVPNGPNPLPQNIPIIWGQQIGNTSRCLAVICIPSNFLWLDAMRCLRAVLSREAHRGIRRVIRTVEAGEQIFWIGCDSVSTAAYLRGSLYGRSIYGYPSLDVEFIHGDVWSARASWAKETWTPKEGLTLVSSISQTPEADVSSYTRSTHSAQPLPSADFFNINDPDDRRVVARLYAASPQVYHSSGAHGQIASLHLLYQRLEATRPPDDDTILTRRQRRAREHAERKRERERSGQDGEYSPLHGDDHFSEVQEGAVI